MNSMDGGDDHDKKRKKGSTIKSSRIDHTYYDYSTRQLSELLPPEKIYALGDKKGRTTFPMKLHAIVSDPKYRHIICWMPHGRSWKIMDKELLASVVCREHFNHDNFDSINRSINGWGFKRLMRAGPDQKSYYHELFLRGRPELTQAMTRLINPGKRLPDPKGEPDFYDISRRFPLPEDSNYVAQNHSDHEQRMLSPPIREVSSRGPPERNPSAPWGYPSDAKRQRLDRQSIPTAQPAGFTPYGHHPGFDYGYGQYHYPPYPYPYPYNFPPGPFGQHFGHPYFQNPHVPSEHLPANSHHLAQQQWSQYHSQYANDVSGTGPSRREGLDVEQKHQFNPSAHRHHAPSEQLEESANADEKPQRSYDKQNRPPVIHRGSAASEKPASFDPSFDDTGPGHPRSSKMTTQYVFPAYGASSLMSPEISYRHPPSEAGDFDSATDYKGYSSYTTQEKQPDKAVELDERKPAANRSPVVEKRVPTGPVLSFTPVRNNQRLEWTESFSDDVCNYLLEDNDGVQRFTKNEEDQE